VSEILTLTLPDAAEQRGTIYADPATHYGLGDVCEIELANSYIVDVGWNNSMPDVGPFKVVIYTGTFDSKHFYETRFRTPQSLVVGLNRLLLAYGKLEAPVEEVCDYDQTGERAFHGIRFQSATNRGPG